MNPTIIFDMDGVIVRSEQSWAALEPAYLRSIISPEAANQIIGNTVGLSVSLVYEWAKTLGFTGSKASFYSGYNTLAETIYRTCPITDGMDELLGDLAKHGVRIGLVSSSPMNTIQRVVDRLHNGSVFSFIESVDDPRH